ncbi:MAG: hypothetical protein D6746_14815 [Bacteroidetes bacterium]|nr:MAG: hypothetical protein D6746_14815 [Bacteroidota bacterium]
MKNNAIETKNPVVCNACGWESPINAIILSMDDDGFVTFTCPQCGRKYWRAKNRLLTFADHKDLERASFRIRIEPTRPLERHPMYGMTPISRSLAAEILKQWRSLGTGIMKHGPRRWPGTRSYYLLTPQGFITFPPLKVPSISPMTRLHLRRRQHQHGGQQ